MEEREVKALEVRLMELARDIRRACFALHKRRNGPVARAKLREVVVQVEDVISKIKDEGVLYRNRVYGRKDV